MNRPARLNPPLISLSVTEHIHITHSDVIIFGKLYNSTIHPLNITTVGVDVNNLLTVELLVIPRVFRHDAMSSLLPYHPINQPAVVDMDRLTT